jgi:hypothetical protein
LSTSGFQQRVMLRDPRDLSPLPPQPRDNYSEAESASVTPAPAPAPSPTAAPVASTATGTKKKKKKSSKATPALSPTAQALVSPTNNVSTAPALKPMERSAWDNVDMYYGFFLNGPSIGSDWGTTYSPFQQGTWPMYIYHTLDAQYHFDRTHLIGVEVSSHQDLTSGVTPSGWTAPVSPKFDFNDPQFWYTKKGVLNNRYFSTDAQFSVWPAVTSYSLDQMGEYFSAAVDTTWNLKLRDYRWNTYFTTRIRPTVYGTLINNDTYNREWMYMSAGYYVGYTLSNSWQINLSGVFDCNLYADNVQLWNRGDGTDDRAQLELNYYLGHVARIGGYFQSVVTNPSLVSSIVGLDITINMLTAKP